MGENHKSYIDHTENDFDKTQGQEEITIELDLSDVEQKMLDEDSIQENGEATRKKGWKSLLVLTVSITAICGASIFLLTSIFQGSFLLGDRQDPSVIHETVDSDALGYQEAASTEEKIPDAEAEKTQEPKPPAEVEFGVPAQTNYPIEQRDPVLQHRDSTPNATLPPFSPPGQTQTDPSVIREPETSREEPQHQDFRQ